MWNVPHLIQIQKARLALRNGNLDDAFTIVTRERLEDYRQSREILEALVDPLLVRARAHLEARRLEDALADVERAQRAGGNRPEIAELREKVLAEYAQNAKLKQEVHQVLESARRRIEDGRLEECAERLAAVPEGGAEQAGELQRRLEQRARQAKEAAARIEESLSRADVENAMAAAESLKAVAANESETRALLDRVAGALEGAVVRAMTMGNLAEARRLLDKARTLGLAAPQARQWQETLDTAEKTALAVARGDWASALVQARRLERFLPDVWWVSQTNEQLMMAEEALRGLRAGPLGDRFGNAAAPKVPLHALSTCGVPELTSAPPPPAEWIARAGAAQAAPKAQAGPARGRYLLWVDGVGSYLVLSADCVTIGRAGSSNRPDIALSADIAGVHAQILRVDHEYFLAPQAAVAVNGAPVSRHLLANGDELTLGARTKLAFKLPTALSSTAMLELPSGLQVARDVNKVILLDQHLVFGPRGNAHIAVSGLTERVVVSLGAEGFRCRAQVPLVVDGKVCGRDAAVPVGAPVEAGPVTFTLTAAPGEGGRA